jgi:hypothetical protein
VLDVGFTTPALRPPLDPCQRTRILRLVTPPLRNHLQVLNGPRDAGFAKS